LDPVGFHHHTLSKSEHNYSTTDREFLAIVKAVKRFRVCLVGQTFDLITDHRPLTYFNSIDVQDPHGRRGRWMEQLQAYRFTPIYKEGRSGELSMADFLSRVEANGKLPTAGVNLVQWNGEAIAQEQSADPQIQPMYSQLRKFELGPDGILRYLNFKRRKCVENGLGRRLQKLVVVPSSRRWELLKLVHDHDLSGHMGIERSWHKIRQLAWWPHMKDDVREYVKTCELCQRFKRSKQPETAPLQSTQVPLRPFEKIQVDFCGPLPIASDGSSYFLAVQDVFSRFSLLAPTADCTSQSAVAQP
jgi:hypothetical protein